MSGSQCNATAVCPAGNAENCSNFLLTYLQVRWLWDVRSGYIWLCSGYLYIANVISSDDREGHRYVCIANNPVLGAHHQGHDQQVVTIVKPGMVDP